MVLLTFLPNEVFSCHDFGAQKFDSCDCNIKIQISNWRTPLVQKYQLIRENTVKAFRFRQTEQAVQILFLKRPIGLII